MATDRTYFKENTQDVVDYLKKISEEHKAAGIQLSLLTMCQWVRHTFKLPKFVKPVSAKGKKLKGYHGDNMRFIIWKLCKKHEIWFGKPAE